MDEFYCYCLNFNSKRKSYVGATKNMGRRLRQHNGFIKGGSKYCRKDRPWKLMIKVGGFLTWSQTLQFEWAWKYQTRQITKKYFNHKNVIERRILALEILLNKDKWTRNSLSSKDLPLNIYISNNIVLYDKIQIPLNKKIIPIDF